jgi:hypothetical protein
MSRFLRIFPGEKDFKEVSEKEYNHVIHPHRIEQLVGERESGLVIALEAELLKFDRPGGRLIEARKWQSESYVRWFARILRMLISFSNEPLTDETGAAYNSLMALASGFQSGFLPDPTFTDRTGALMAIGQGVAVNNSGFFGMQSLVGQSIARSSLFTTQQDAVAIVMSIDQGITIATPGTVNITEIGLFSQIWDTTQAGSANGAQSHITLLAYDQVTSTPFTQGQVAAPKYTLNFTA